MRRPSRTDLSWVLVIFIQAPLTAQNLEAIGREKPFSLSGGISLNQIAYTSRGISARRAPYDFFAGGNINLSLYSWTVPLAFNLSNRRATFAQPFNRYTAHPSWRWIKAHLGHVSMSFSPYTVNGHIFRGLGVDLDPGNHWRISALYGRFMKAAGPDSLSAQPPAFERHGAGLRTRWESGDNFMEVIVFHAIDDRHSIRMPHDVLPRENLVASFAGGKTLFKHFVLKTEVATSALTRDVRAERSRSAHLLAKISPLFAARVSTAYYEAFKTSFDFQRDGWAVGLGYERIDPGYQTLGAYYFNNDLENITLNGTARLLQEKLSVAGSAGLQKDNIDHAKASTMRRIVSACQVGYVPSQKLNVSASWSTFRTFSNIRPQFETLTGLTPYDNPDTLNYTQLSRSAAASVTYAVRASASKRQTVALNASWQKSADTHGTQPPSAATSYCNLNAGYSVSWAPKNTTASLTYQLSMHQGPLTDMYTRGPMASLTRSWMNRKLRTTFSASWNDSRGPGGTTSSLVNARMNSAWTLRDRHSFTLAGVLVRRTQRESLRAPIIEMTVTAGYQYSFSTRRNERITEK